MRTRAARAHALQASGPAAGAPFETLHCPPPRFSRVVLRDINITIALADTFTTVLLPEELDAEFGSGGEVQPEAEAEAVPMAGLVQGKVERLCVQVDHFACDSDVAARLAVSIHSFEVRDSFQHGGSGGTAGGTALQRLLGYHASVRTPRDPQACMLAAVVEVVRGGPDAGAEWRVRRTRRLRRRAGACLPGAACASPTYPPPPHPARLAEALEHRVQVELLPLRVQLDQRAVVFLQHFAEALDAGGPAVAAPQSQPRPAGARARGACRGCGARCWPCSDPLLPHACGGQPALAAARLGVRPPALVASAQPRTSTSNAARFIPLWSPSTTVPDAWTWRRCGGAELRALGGGGRSGRVTHTLGRARSACLGEGSPEPARPCCDYAPAAATLPR